MLSLFVLIILPVSFAVTFIYLYYQKQFKVWDALGIPHTKQNFPLGDANGIGIRTNAGFRMKEIYDNFKNEKFVGFWMMYRPHLLVRHPELIKDIFVRNFMSFHDRGINVNTDVDPLGGILFSLGGQKWRNLRVKLSPAFTSGKMKMMFPIFVECSNLFKDAMEKHATYESIIDVKELSACFTTDVISLSAFGVRTNSLVDPNAEFRKYGRQVLEPTAINGLRLVTSVILPNLHKLFKLRTFDKESCNFFLNAFRESVDYRTKNNIKRNDFFDLLLQLLQKGKLEGVDEEVTNEGTSPEKFTFEEAAAQAFMFFAAGFETSSTTMQFSLYELARNVEIQNKCREEIDNVLEKFEGKITYESVNQMEYLTRVISETLRKYPPVPFLSRKCNQDYPIPGTNIVLPKGMPIVVDILGMQNDEKHFPDPEKFDPERFTEEEKAKRHHYSYLPFGEGPRNCLGMRFGLLQTKMGLLTLLKNFEFHVSKETNIPLIWDNNSLILAPKNGMFLKITKRS